MLFDYEIVEHQEGLPIKVYFVHVGQIKVHWHKDIELMLVLKGSVILNCGDHAETIKCGEIRLLNCYETHFLQETDEDNIVLGMQIDGDITKSVWHPLSHILIDDRRFNEDMVKEIKAKMCQVVSEMDASDMRNNLSIMAKLYELLCVITNAQSIEFRPQNSIEMLEKDFARLDSFIKLINEKYSERLTLQEVADHLYISKYHLSHFIKKRLGVNFQNFLTMIRLQHACEAIIFSTKTMIDIASECGFSDVKFMTKIVKDKYNMTPTNLRKSRQVLTNTPLTMDKKGHKPFDISEAHQLLKSYL